MEISADKLQDYVVTNNRHNLTKVIRTRSEQGVFSDYPHKYKLVQEGKQLLPETDIDKYNNQPEKTENEEDDNVPKPYFGDLFAQRLTENGEFIISCKPGDFTLYGPHHVGILKPNFLGTQFELFNHGYEEVIYS